MKVSGKTIIAWIAAVLSGVLLAISYPPFEEGVAAWFAFLPLLILARYSTPYRAFRLGFLGGMIFWLCSLAWLLRLRLMGGPVLLVGLGWIALAAYCSLYMAAFLMVVSAIAGIKEKRNSAPLGTTLYVVGAPLVWVGLEYIRSVILSGFPWNTLGISQYENLSIIQIAEYGGVYAVSAVVMLMNVVLSLTAGRFVAIYTRGTRARQPRFILAIGLGVVLLCLFLGVRRARETDAEYSQGMPLRITAVQPNIPQDSKWLEEFSDEIYTRLESATRFAAMAKPALIIWPETAVPACLNADPAALAFVRDLASEGSPLLIGSVEAEQRGSEVRFYNSSFLMDTNGAILDTYRKRHLVPFGEYVPLDKTITPLQRLVPIGVTCWPGKTSTVFRLPVSPGTKSTGDRTTIPFSVLICFEDTMPFLARDAVRNGARLLINQTNDAWFDGSSASRQHMSHCVFRCIENRVPAVRSGNTGVTCFIDAVGRIDRTTRQLAARQETDSMTYRTANVTILQGSKHLTVYSRYGDWIFAFPCMGLAIIGIVWVIRSERRQKLLLDARGEIKDTAISKG